MLKQGNKPEFTQNLAKFLVSIITDQFFEEGNAIEELKVICSGRITDLRTSLTDLDPIRSNKLMLEQLRDYMEDNSYECQFQKVAQTDKRIGEGKVIRELRAHEKAEKGLSMWLWKYMILANRPQ